MPQSGTRSLRTRLDTYTAYGIGCAAVWAAILIATQLRTDSQTRNTIRLMCAGWWLGWISASIACVVYPPPKELKPEIRKQGRDGVARARGGRHHQRRPPADSREQPAVTAADASAPLGTHSGSTASRARGVSSPTRRLPRVRGLRPVCLGPQGSANRRRDRGCGSVSVG
jgi:hypothetical protein